MKITPEAAATLLATQKAIKAPIAGVCTIENNTIVDLEPCEYIELGKELFIKDADQLINHDAIWAIDKETAEEIAKTKKQIKKEGVIVYPADGQIKGILIYIMPILKIVKSEEFTVSWDTSNLSIVKKIKDRIKPLRMKIECDYIDYDKVEIFRYTHSDIKYFPHFT